MAEAKLPDTNPQSLPPLSPGSGEDNLLNLGDDILNPVINMLLDEIEAAEITHRIKCDRWDRYQELYKSKPEVERKSYPWPDASNLCVGLVPIYTDQIIARILQSIFSVEPLWVGIELTKKYADFVKPCQDYLDWCRTNMWDQYSITKKAVVEACKLGTSVIYNGWMELDFPSSPTLSTVPGGKLRGPAPEWVSRRNFLIPNGYDNLQQAPWIARKQTFSYQDLQRLEFSKFFENTEKLKDEPDDDLNNPSEFKNTSTNDFSPRTVYQIWFRYDFDGDGFPEDYVVTLHKQTKTILKGVRVPYLFGMRPFVKITYLEQEGEFDGIGVPEQIEQYQEEVTTQHNQRVDNAHLANTKVILARKGAGFTKSRKLSPGDIIEVTDPNTDVKELRLSEVYPSSVTNEQLTIGLAERRIGISDVSLGRESPPIGRAAATTVMALLQEGTRRFDLNISEVRKALTEQGIQIFELWQTHGLPEPNEPGSPEQILDDKDAASVRDIITSTREDGIRGLIGFKLNASTAAVNKEIEKQSNIQLAQIVAQYSDKIVQTLIQLGPYLLNPQIPPAFKEVVAKLLVGNDKMLTKVFQSHSAYDLEGILVGEIISDFITQQSQGQPNAPGLSPNVAPSEAKNPGDANGMSQPASNGGGGSNQVDPRIVQLLATHGGRV